MAETTKLSVKCSPATTNSLENAADRASTTKSALIRKACHLAIEAPNVALDVEGGMQSEMVTFRAEDTLVDAIDAKTDQLDASRSHLLRWAVHYAAETGQATIRDRPPAETSSMAAHLSSPGLLTERQAQAYLLRGLGNAPPDEVAQELGVSRSTLSTHLQKAKQKVERAEATIEAIKDVDSCANCGGELGDTFTGRITEEPYCFYCSLSEGRIPD